MCLIRIDYYMSRKEAGILKRLKEMPLSSGLLVIVNVLVFFVCMFTGSVLYDIGMLNVRGVLEQREYGRILWAMFLHGGINHIFNNMLILFSLGL